MKINGPLRIPEFRQLPSGELPDGQMKMWNCPEANKFHKYIKSMKSLTFVLALR